MEAGIKAQTAELGWQRLGTEKICKTKMEAGVKTRTTELGWQRSKVDADRHMVKPEVRKSGGWRRWKASGVRGVEGVIESWRVPQGNRPDAGRGQQMAEVKMVKAEKPPHDQGVPVKGGMSERNRENSESTMTEVSKKDQNIPKGTRYPKRDQKPSDDIQIETGENQLRDWQKAGTEMGIAAQLYAHPKHRKSGTEKGCPPTM
ncbi:hypothetical protein B0H10DRAFT_1961310 [Mycena sp. CBHHK59/15]|nr:hypothetical protein B0H10DRAFT_1961310 [Mycena sp. CBHHK59/15]